MTRTKHHFGAFHGTPDRSLGVIALTHASQLCVLTCGSRAPQSSDSLVLEGLWKLAEVCGCYCVMTLSAL